MLSFVVFLTCACTASAFIAPERNIVKPSDVAAWRESVKLKANYLDGLDGAGGGKRAPPKAASYSPFKKNPKPTPNADDPELQPYFEETKIAAAEAIGHVLEARAAAEEAGESLNKLKELNGEISTAPVTPEPEPEPEPEPVAFVPPVPAAPVTPEPATFAPPAPVVPEPATIAPPAPAVPEPATIMPSFAEPSEPVEIMPSFAEPTAPAEIVPVFSQMSPNAPVLHGADDPTIPLAYKPKGRDYITDVDGPPSLNFRDSFAPYPKGHSMVGKGSYDSFSLSFQK